jgi:type II secretory pathway component PulF
VAFVLGLMFGLGGGAWVRSATVVLTTVDLSDLERSLIGAGERGGKLEQSFDHLSGYFAMLDETRRRVKRAMIYPVILLHAGVLLPSIPKVIMAQGEVSFFEMALVPLLVMYAVVIVGYLAVRSLMNRARTETGADALLRRIPLVGKARESLALSRFCRVFYMHLLAAISMSESVRAAGGAAQSGLIGEAAKRVESEVARGMPLGESMLDEGAFPVSFTTSMNTAEESGTLDVELGRWAEVYRDRAVAAMDAAGDWYPKVFYVVVVVIVAWQILSVALSYGRLIEGVMEQIGW